MKYVPTVRTFGMKVLADRSLEPLKPGIHIEPMGRQKDLQTSQQVYRVTFFVRSADKPSERRTFYVRRGPRNSLSRQKMQQQIDLLRKLEATLPQRHGATVPRVLGTDDDGCLVALSDLPGRGIQRWFYLAASTGIGLSEACRAAGQIGRWLGEFQRSSVQHSVCVGPDVFCCAQRFLQEEPTLFFRDDRTFFTELLSRERSRSAVVPLVGTHGDFTLRNILMDGSHLRVMDWEESQAGDPMIDSATFVVSLCHMSRFWMSRGRIRMLAAQFFARWSESVWGLGVDSETATALGLVWSLNQLSRRTGPHGRRRRERFVRTVGRIQRELADSITIP